MNTKMNSAVALAMKQKHSKLSAPSSSDQSIAKLQERAMLVRLATGRWYGRGADESVVQDAREKAGARGDIGTFTKRLMERQHLAAIDAVVNDARKYHKAMTLSWAEPFRILSADLFLDYRATMAEYESKFETEVRKFLKRFDELKAGEKARLKGLFKESDYPSHDALKKRFYISVRFEAVPDADDFRVRLGGEDIAEVKKQIEEQVTAGLREATVELWRRLHDLVKKLRDVLASSDASVRGALFDHLKEIVAIMPRLNLTGDPKLDALTQRVAKELLAEDVGAIKEDDKLRNDLAKKADSILDAMSSFIGEVEPE